MKNKTLFAVAVLMLTAGIIFFLLHQKITGEVVSDSYSFTKAICNETACQDYEIVCNGNRTISRSLLSGAVVQHSTEWEDPREDEFKNKECENFYES